MVDLWWDDPDAEHITTRSTRYPGAQDIEVAWTLQAAADPVAVLHDPDPRSRAGYLRLVGFSPTTGVITVIIDPEDSSGVTAWKTRGADLRTYLQQKDRSDDLQP